MTSDTSHPEVGELIGELRVDAKQHCDQALAQLDPDLCAWHIRAGDRALNAADALASERTRAEALEKERDEAVRARDHTQYWYAVRLEPIKDVAKREGIWPEVAAIIANGNGTRQLPDGTWKYEPPTYAQQLNRAEHRAKAANTLADKAEAEVAALSARVAELEAGLRPFATVAADHSWWMDARMCDRLSDWFEPVEFERARALSGQEGR